MIRTVFYAGSALLVTLFTSLAFMACQGSEEKEDRFDRGAMLRHYAEQLIIPAYTDLQQQVNSLQSVASTFTSDPSGENLSILQEQWINAYVSFQYANAYNFGPAGEAGTQKNLVEEIATFPVSATKIDQAVASGTYNLNDFNRDARGFLAIEYLIFDLEDDNAGVVGAFTETQRQDYLNDLVDHIASRVDAVVNAWNGSYKHEFISKTGTDVGSGTSMLYNEFVKSFESIKNFKVALPLGLRPGQTSTEPTRVEAYYSGKSIQMIKAHFNAIENIWYGRTGNGSDGTGFREYLENVEGGNALISSTETQLAVIRTKLDGLSDTPRLSEQLVSQPEAFDALHTELQNHIRFFKSDMSSLLGIAITYASGDGD